MRGSLAIALVLPVALSGCPAVLSDWTIGDGATDASPNSEAAGGTGSVAGGGTGGRGGATTVEAGSGGGRTGAGGVSTGGAPATGGAYETGGAPVVDACTLVTHDNGLGQTWQDCLPLGTYTGAQTLRACEAWCAENGCTCFSGSVCGANYILGQASDVMMGWTWKAPNEGDVVKVLSGQVSCVKVGTWT